MKTRVYQKLFNESSLEIRWPRFKIQQTQFTVHELRLFLSNDLHILPDLFSSWVGYVHLQVSVYEED